MGHAILPYADPRESPIRVNAGGGALVGTNCRTFRPSR